MVIVLFLTNRETTQLQILPNFIFMEIPYDVFVLLVSYLPVTTIIQVSRVCKSWHQHVLRTCFWHDLVRSSYPETYIEPQQSNRLSLHLISLKPRFQASGETHKYLSFLLREEMLAAQETPTRLFRRFLINPGRYYPVELGFRNNLKNLLVSAYTQAGALLKIHYYLPDGHVIYTRLVEYIVNAYPQYKTSTQCLHQYILTHHIKVVAFRAVRISHH